MRTAFQPMVKVLRPGEQGVARVDHFEIDEARARMLAAIDPRDCVGPGRYARLLVNGQTMMSDTHMEHRSNYAVVREARGRVLVAGLGIGMIVLPILAKPEVQSLTVVELHADVIDLVEPQVRRAAKKSARKLTVVHSDIHDYAERGPWDVIYFDIWPGKCTDQLAEITKLKRRFVHRRAPGGWMHAWCEEELRYRRRSGW